MKKIFFSLLLLFSFSTIAFAQEGKSNDNDPKTLAKSELSALVKEIPLESSIENGIFSLLVYKHQALSKATTEKERNQIYETIKSKLEGTFSPDVFRKLKNNKALYENLIK